MSDIDIAKLVIGYLSEQGFERTKSTFCQECPTIWQKDLDEEDVVVEGQKLSLIIEEYFVLKGHDKKSKRDPESILKLLWKQFDSLVGQLKYSTFHGLTVKNSDRAQSQKVRVREMNRRRASFQRSATNVKHQATNNRQAVLPSNIGVPGSIMIAPKPPGMVPVVVPNQVILPNQSEPKRPITPTSTPIGDNPRPLPVKSPTCRNGLTKTQPMAKNTTGSYPSTNTVLQHPHMPPPTVTSNIQPSVAVLSSSVLLQPPAVQEPHHQLTTTPTSSPFKNHIADIHMVAAGENFKSPKRKSVQPKRRPMHTDGTANQVATTEQSPVKSIDITSVNHDDMNLDSFVEKFLGQPEFSEKLAENINRAVDLNIPASESEPVTKDSSSCSVVDSEKVDNIVEMMANDPIFGKLFSTFESFTNSCDENVFDVVQDMSCTELLENSETSASNILSPKEVTQNEASLRNASLASDALLLLANSPAKFPNKPPGLSPATNFCLQTPQKDLLDDLSVQENQGRTTNISNNQDCHIRQLDFTPSNHFLTTVEQCSSGQPRSTCNEPTSSTAKPFTSCVSFRGMVPKNSQKESNVPSEKDVDSVAVLSSAGNDIGKSCRMNIIGYKSISRCSEMDEDRGGTTGEGSDTETERSERKDDKCESGEKAMEINIREKTGKKGGTSKIEEARRENKEPNVKNIVCSSSENEESSLSVLEELATMAFSRKEGMNKTDGLTMDRKEPSVTNVDNDGDTVNECAMEQASEQVRTRKVQRVRKKTEHNETNKNEAITTLAIASTRNTDLDCDSVGVRDEKTQKDTQHEQNNKNTKKVSQKTPLVKDSGSSSTQVAKRKLKKNKHSNGSSKKRRTLPMDLDVDKFLSRLHYAEDNTK